MVNPAGVKELRCQPSPAPQILAQWFSSVSVLLTNARTTAGNPSLAVWMGPWVCVLSEHALWGCGSSSRDHAWGSPTVGLAGLRIFTTAGPPHPFVDSASQPVVSQEALTPEGNLRKDSAFY